MPRRSSTWLHAVQLHTHHRASQQPLRNSAIGDAYAVMWYGNTSSRAFDSLRVLLHSIRSFDGVRSIVIMLPCIHAGPCNGSNVDSALHELQLIIPRVVLRHVQPLTIFQNTSKVCRGSASSACGSGSIRSYMFSYSKFALWSLTEWSRLLYLDTDMMVTDSLEDIWETRFREGYVAAASHVIRAKTQKGLPERACGTREARKLGFSTGMVLLEPSVHLWQSLLNELHGRWRFMYKNPCRGDQTYFNYLFPPNTECLPYSANCRDPWFVSLSAAPTPKAPLATLSRCLERTANATLIGTTMPPPGSSARLALKTLPYAVHFACGTKPYRTENQNTFFAELWRNNLRAHQAARRLSLRRMIR